MYRIGVVAPGGPLKPETPNAILSLAERDFAGRVEIVFHPQCFYSLGHFAGDDAARAAALLEIANDPAFDAVWFGRGGYGSGRLLDHVLPQLNSTAKAKAWLGYSDAGVILAALYGAGFRRLAHGPMAQDILREGGEAAAQRAISWLVDQAPGSLEPTVGREGPACAFNLAILSSLVGTPWLPDLSGHVLMLEDVAEYMYRIDRFFFHVTANPEIRKVAGIRMGRVIGVPENDPDFGMDEIAVAKAWCQRSGIPYLGEADIGHDAQNKVVPFGTFRASRP